MRLVAFVVLLSLPLTARSQEESKAEAGKQADSKTEKAPVSSPPAKPAKAPPKFRVKFETTQGDFVIEVKREWAPLGADQFYNLVKTRYFDGNRFFRVLPGFVVQWGLNSNPKATANWKRPIKDDPVVASNLKGYITYATAGKNTRTTQLFVNLADNQRLDRMGFAPFGKVVSGMDVLEKLYSGYGESASNKQNSIRTIGLPFLKDNFPKLDYIKTARILKKVESAKGDQKASDKP